MYLPATVEKAISMSALSEGEVDLSTSDGGSENIPVSSQQLYNYKVLTSNKWQQPFPFG